MDHFMLSPTTLYLLAVWFLGGGVFYLYRLICKKKVTNIYNYWDWENEVAHGICMIAMVTMLTPALLPISAQVWALVLGVAAVWFLARALTWGRRWKWNIWWYDWSHVGMFLCMAAMFHPLTAAGWFTAVQAIYWAGHACYYAHRLYRDAKLGAKWLSAGADVSHFSMQICMLLMTLRPHWFMMGMMHHM